MKRNMLKYTAVLLVLLMALGTNAFAQDEVSELNVLYWQAPSTMNPYLSGGTKEIEAASVTIEPLARYDQDGNMVPWLVDEIPTVENGGVSEDLTQITWVLSEGILWSDGTPLTLKMLFSPGSIAPTLKVAVHPSRSLKTLPMLKPLTNVLSS